MTVRLGTVGESNSAPTSLVSGSLASGGLAGMTVIGVALAGQRSGNVGSDFVGTFGTLRVNADGSYEYALDNADPDTDLLSTGETALDRFVVTFRLNGEVRTLDVEIAVNGLNEPGQSVVTYNSSKSVGPDTAIADGTFVRFVSSEGFLSEGDSFVNYGSIAFRSTGENLQGFAVFHYGPDNSFVNSGRITATSSQDRTGDIYAVLGFGTNNGVLSATHTAPYDAQWPAGRAVGGQGILVNTGLIEAVSNFDAYGVWDFYGSSFHNTGFVYVEGGAGYAGQPTDPLGIIGFRSGGIANVVNEGTVYVVSNTDQVESVGFRFFANGSNIYNQMTFENSGTIVAGRAIILSGNYEASIDLVNSGHIEGTLEITTGVNVIVNQAGAYWDGDFLLGPNPDSLTNAGRIVGNVRMGSGSDRYEGIGSGRVIGDVLGGAGNDLLSGGGGPDRLFGGDGSDIILGGNGADTLGGGSGKDSFVYRSAGESVAGTRDTIVDFQSGTDTIDISALGTSNITLTVSGSSTILRAATATGTLEVLVQGSVAASDIITKAPSSKMDGSGAADNLYARTQGAVLNGLAGNDSLFGSAGADVLNGGPGMDHMYGGDGDDIYHLDDFGDLVLETANGGTDEVRGTISFILPNYVENGRLLGTQDLALRGNALDNVLIGNSGNNLLIGESGNNVLVGGLGGDWLQLNKGFHRVVYNTVDDSTASNPDMLQTYSSVGVRDNYLVDLRALDVQTFTVTGEHKIMDASGAGAFWITYTELTVATASGNLVLLIEGDLILRAFDWTRPEGAGGVLNGWNGNDRLAGSSGSDTIQGFGGNDFINGDAGNDVLHGGTGDDQLEGGGGNDLLSGGAGRDILNGNAGNDTVSYRSASSAVTVSLAKTAAQDTGGEGFDTLAGIENLFGSAFGDTLTGNSANNALAGEAGDDTLIGAGGNDTLDGGGGTDTAVFAGLRSAYTISEISPGVFQIVGPDGSDTLRNVEFARFDNATVSLESPSLPPVFGTPGADVLQGTAGADEIHGGGGDDLIYGLAGWDILYGDGGSDELIGGDGNDRLDGGEGNDVLRAHNGDDELSGGAGDDQLNAGGGNDVLQGHSGNDILRGQAGDDTLRGGADNDDLFGGSQHDTLYGEAGNDRLYGNEGDDFVNGGIGDDNVFGGAGMDRVYGGAGNDIMNGHGGDDFIVGGPGIDLLVGGLGADRFVFLDGDFGADLSATDRIKDFAHDQGDLIDLTRVDADTASAGDQAFTWIGNAAFSGTAGELRYDWSGNTTVITGDTDGDGTADFALWLTGQVALVTGDFAL